MGTAKHTYTIEGLCPSRGWLSIGGEWAKTEAKGYLRCHASTSGPKMALRIRRSDGRVIDESQQYPFISFDAFTGWPTPEQYLMAAARTIEQATRERRKYSKLPDLLTAMAACEQALSQARIAFADFDQDGT